MSKSTFKIYIIQLQRLKVVCWSSFNYNNNILSRLFYKHFGDLFIIFILLLKLLSVSL